MASKNHPGEPLDPRSSQPWINPKLVLGDTDISLTPYEKARNHLLTHPASDRLVFVEQEVYFVGLTPAEAEQVITAFPLEPKELGKVVKDMCATFKKQCGIQLPQYDVTFGPPNMCNTDYQNRKILFPGSGGLDLVSNMAFHLGLILHWEQGEIYRQLKAIPPDSKEHATLREQSENLVAGFPAYCMWLYATKRDARIKKEFHTLYVRRILNDSEQAKNLKGMQAYVALSDAKGVATAIQAGLTVTTDEALREYVKATAK